MSTLFSDDLRRARALEGHAAVGLMLKTLTTRIAAVVSHRHDTRDATGKGATGV